MTQQQMIEIIEQHHSQMGETEIRLALNNVQDIYCAQTELIKETYTQNSTAGQRYYSLDPKIIKITNVQVNDVDIPRILGRPIIDDDEFDSQPGLGAGGTASNERYWYVDSGRLGVIEKIAGVTTRDDRTSNYQSISVAKELRIYAISKATDFTTDLTEVSLIPTEFHEALVYKVIADGYLKSGHNNFNPENSAIFDMKYKELVKEGKKQARSNKVGGFSIVKGIDF